MCTDTVIPLCVDTIGTAQSVLIKELGVLISKVGLYTNVVVGTLEIVLIIELSCPYFRVS